MKIAVAGTGYVGLSLAVLLSQHNDVVAVDIIPEKVDKINRWESPIQDEYIEKFMAEAKAGERHLSLTATTDGASAYADSDFVIIAAPTNYDPQKNFFDCSAVESVIDLVLKSSDHAIMVIKSTIPVGYTERVRKQFNTLLFTGRPATPARMGLTALPWDGRRWRWTRARPVPERRLRLAQAQGPARCRRGAGAAQVGRRAEDPPPPAFREPPRRGG